MTSSASISTQSAAGSPSIRDDSPEFLLDPVGQLGRHRRDLAGRAPGGDHHMVGDVRFAGERDGHDFLRLVVVERLQDERVERRRHRSERGRRLRRRSCGTCGQVVSSDGQWRADRAPMRAAIGPVRCQSGSSARMAVAEVGSGGRRRNKIAGALHSVHCLAWLAGRTNRRSQPIARAAWAAPIITRAGHHRNRQHRGLSPCNRAICENPAGCRFRATR